MILFERNIERQKESIGRHALRYSLPNALAIVMAVIAALTFVVFTFPLARLRRRSRAARTPSA